MGRACNARKLTLIGIMINGLVVAFAFSWHMILLFPTILGTIPDELFILSLNVAVGFLFFGTSCGVILPFWGYRRITPADKTIGSALLLISGGFSLFISILGGILLLIAGFLTTYWEPTTETHPPLHS